mgnify:CR=1 FL=1
MLKKANKSWGRKILKRRQKNHLLKTIGKNKEQDEIIILILFICLDINLSIYLKKNQFESIDLVDPYYAQLDTLNDFTVLEFPQFENYDVCVILTPHNVFNQDERYSKYVHSEECYIVDLYGAFNSKTLFLL